MKKSILTLHVLLIGMVAMGQVKKDTGYWAKFKGLGVSASPIYINTNDTALYVYNPHPDTVKCWFKELVVCKPSVGVGGWIKCDQSDYDATIQEQWYKGYSVTSPYSIRSTYLYSDRKTRVTNQVIFSIERK